MKKIINIISGVFVVATVLSSCERDISTLNVDPKHPEVVLSSNLVASTEQALFDQMVTPSVNFNVSRFFTQQWTETQYIDETNYNFVTRNQPQNHYNTMMRRVLQPLKQAKIYLPNEAEDPALNPSQTAKVKANKAAINEFISVFAWKNLVETFGNIPYTDALKNTTGDENLQPKYDDAATIYANLVVRLNAAIASVDPSFSGYDNEIVYHGDMEQWLKMANSVKLEMGLMLSDVNAGTAKTLVESAYQAGVIMDEADNFALQYEAGQFSNPIYQNLVASGRNDFIISDFYVNYLKNLNDPRRITQFSENRNLTLGVVSSVTTVSGVTTVTFAAPIPAASTPAVNKGLFLNTTTEEDTHLGYVAAFGSDFVTLVNSKETISVGNTLTLERYIGGPYGSLATFANFTHVAVAIKSPTAKGLIIDHVQVKFQLAEAAARGFTVGGTPAVLYNQAVTASMNQWNVSSEETVAYLASHPYDAANWKKSLGEQSWIAMHNRGFEAWNFWRRLDYPVLTKPGGAESLVYRMPYSFNEYSTNTANVTSAATAIGGDKYGTKLFFDKF